MVEAAPSIAESESGTAAAAAQPFRVRPRPVSTLQNRMLGLVLGSLVFLVFVTVITLVLVFHQAEAHHVIAAQ
jgi:hypothetical protein